MIGHLRGTLLRIGEDTVLLDVQGVGYEVSTTPRHLSRLHQGEEASFAIETLVAETFIRLVGFESETERRAFRLLQGVQGVGAKAALAILQVLTPTALMDAVAMGDKAAVSRAQGVGPKLAQRIVTELKGKTTGLLGAEDFEPSSPHPPSAETTPPVRHDAVSALVNLGYEAGLAGRAVAAIPVKDHETVESLITDALKGLSVA
ncbi:MAG: Holliday junction branch migration protein RuvA [Pseudomonadota bacterium]